MENDRDQWYLVNEKARTNAVIIKSEKKKNNKKGAGKVGGSAT